MKSDSTPHNLLQDYFAGTADEKQVQQLSAWIEASSEHAEYVQALGWLDQALTHELQNQSVDHLSAEERAFIDRVDPDAWQMILDSAIRSRLQREKAAYNLKVEPQDQAVPTPSIGVLDAVSLAGYFAAKGLRTKAGVIVSIAAVVLLGAALYLSFIGLGIASDPQPLAGTTPNTAGVRADRVIATLTAERDARWDRRPGDDLYAGQRFTLTQGYAEITTQRGAVAIFEAPATFEMLDSDNAVRLHAGKLVGICETESSHGFTVRTPQMEITDLGTRFGVEVASDRQTEAHVADGEVSLLLLDADTSKATGQPVLLHAGEAARVSIGDRQITRMDADTQRFVAMQPILIELPGTGKGLIANEADPNWAIVAFEGQPLQTPRQPKVNNNRNYQNLFPNDPANSQWLAWDETTLPARPAGTYTRHLFQTTVTLPDTIDPASASIVLRQAADAKVDAIIVNGQRINLNLPAPDPRATWRSTEVIDRHLVAGENTIGFEVLNRWNKLGIAGPVGLRVEWELHGFAPRSNAANEAP